MTKNNYELLVATSRFAVVEQPTKKRGEFARAGLAVRIVSAVFISAGLYDIS